MGRGCGTQGITFRGLRRHLTTQDGRGSAFSAFRQGIDVIGFESILSQVLCLIRDCSSAPLRTHMTFTGTVSTSGTSATFPVANGSSLDGRRSTYPATSLVRTLTS